MQKEIIGNTTLYCGDTMEILPELGECADLLVCDPPYKLTSGGNGGYADWQLAHDYDNNGDIVTCDIDWSDFMPLFYNCLKDSSHAYVMCNNRHVQNMLNSSKWHESEKNLPFNFNEILLIIEKYIPNIKTILKVKKLTGFDFHNLLVWDKGTATPNRWYMKNLEYVGFFKKGKAKFINDCGSKQLIKVPQEDYGNHPTTKPSALMEYYIRNSSNIGDTVIDPFMGVGSTGVASLKSNRKFIGIEIEQKWFDLACKRIEDTMKNDTQKDMFLDN